MTERRLRIAYTVGTRPEIIRSAVMLRLLTASPDFEVATINVGQHYDANMLGDFVGELDVPRIDVDLAVGSADPVVQTATVIIEVGRILDRIAPDALVVFGDTNSSLGAALAAAKAGIPLVHIEAGCRSYDMTMPEEVNRRAIDHVADLLLAVSQTGADNLLRERVPGFVVVIGDPLLDIFVERTPEVVTRTDGGGLLTLHRPENVDQPERLELILDEVAASSALNGLGWTFPMHPRTRAVVRRQLPSCIERVPPLGYGELLATLFSSRVCVTDSGGLQKEALWARVPCVTVRRTTEWPETTAAGANELAQPGIDLRDAIARALDKRIAPAAKNPFGDGNASQRGVEVIREWLLRREVKTSDDP
jgi:UDP-N-acetylglucosamine 2-epimerase